MERYVERRGRTEIRTGFWWGNPKERHHFEKKLGVDWSIILKLTLTIGREGTDRIHLAMEGRDGGLF